MSVTEDLPDMDGKDLLGLLLHGGEEGSTEPFFPDDNGLIESWLFEQDVRLSRNRIKEAMNNFAFISSVNMLPICIFKLANSGNRRKCSLTILYMAV